MYKVLRTFRSAEDGAVTVDWVVLSAAIVGLTVLISTAMKTNAVGSADNIATYMSSWTFN